MDNVWLFDSFDHKQYYLSFFFSSCFSIYFFSVWPLHKVYCKTAAFHIQSYFPSILIFSTHLVHFILHYIYTFQSVHSLFSSLSIFSNVSFFREVIKRVLKFFSQIVIVTLTVCYWIIMYFFLNYPLFW